MTASRIYTFENMAPNSSQSIFIHGYSDNEAVNYSVIAFAGFGEGVPFPLARVLMTQGETTRHVDGTVARVITVQNLAPFNSCTVGILETKESF